MSERVHPVIDSFAAMQVKGPGEVSVDADFVSFYFDGRELHIPRSTFDTMGKVCGSIQTNPLEVLACAITNKPYDHVIPFTELKDHQSYLIGSQKDDPSDTLKDMPRTRCDGKMGVTLYTKGLLI